MSHIFLTFVPAMYTVKKTIFFLLIPFIVPAQSEQGLVAKYTFNYGDTRDEAGKNDAKANGAALTSDRFGNSGSAYFLNANFDSYLNLGTDKVLKPICGTVALWINMETVTYKGRGIRYCPFIITKSHSGDDFFEGYFIGYSTESHRVSANIAPDSIQGANINSHDTLTLNKWHHYVLAYDDHYMWFYVDGVLQNNNRPIVKNFRSQFLETDSVVVGSFANEKNKRCLVGGVDDIFIYNRVLSPAEVSALYHAPDPNRYHIYWVWLYRTLALLVIFIILVLIIIRRYKNALEKEKANNRMNMRLIEMETKAIRTQMNPHFMFNSLNTLQRFILEEDSRGAHAYLAKFSKLLRKILESSTSDSIALDEEMDILKNYVELEKMRFNNSFNYEIKSDIIEPRKYHIPILLVQPFVENAIWHGLLPRQGDRFLTVNFSDADEKTIFCIIEDNGVGRDAGGPKDPLKKKSLALDFIRQRLELLSKITEITCGFTIIDKRDQDGQSTGTRIEIVIPKLNTL